MVLIVVNKLLSFSVAGHSRGSSRNCYFSAHSRYTGYKNENIKFPFFWLRAMFELWQTYLYIFFFILIQFLRLKMTSKVPNFWTRWLKCANLLCKKGLFQLKISDVWLSVAHLIHIPKWLHFCAFWAQLGPIMWVCWV